MARPSPEALIDITDKNTWQMLEVLPATGVYAVVYDGGPINLRVRNALTDGGYKYRRVSFPSPAAAIRHAMMLNEKFGCNRFSAVQLVPGDPVEPRQKGRRRAS